MKKKGGTLKYLRQNYDMYLLLVSGAGVCVYLSSAADVRHPDCI